MLKVRTKKDFLKDFNKHILSGRIKESDVTSIVDCLKEQKPLQQKYCDHAWELLETIDAFYFDFNKSKDPSWQYLLDKNDLRDFKLKF